MRAAQKHGLRSRAAGMRAAQKLVLLVLSRPVRQENSSQFFKSAKIFRPRQGCPRYEETQEHKIYRNDVSRPMEQITTQLQPHSPCERPCLGLRCWGRVCPQPPGKFSAKTTWPQGMEIQPCSFWDDSFLRGPAMQNSHGESESNTEMFMKIKLSVLLLQYYYSSEHINMLNRVEFSITLALWF